MKNTVEKVLMAGLLGGIAIGATVYHAMHIYLADGDKQDPVKEEALPEASASEDEVKPEDAAPEDAAEDIPEDAPEDAAE